MSHNSRVGFLGCIAILVVGATSSASFAQTRPLVLEETAKILPPGPEDLLTIGVALSGNDLLLAARRNFDSPQGFWSEQFAYLFRRASDGSWNYVTTLASTSSPHQQTPPMSAGLRGDVAAVNASELIIYERDSSGWKQTAALPRSGGGSTASSFRDLEIDGGVIVVGGPACAWEAFRKGANGWALAGFASASNTCFQGDLDISGQTIVVANVFVSIPSGGVWPDRVRIYPGLGSSTPTFVTDPLDDGPGGARFGTPVAIDQGIVFAGRAGAVIALERSSDGVWRHQASLEPPDTFALDNGSSLQARGSFIAAGHAEDSVRGRGSGSVRVFQREAAGSYREAARLLARDAAPDAQLGSSVDIDGRFVVATALRAAYVFQLPDNLQQPVLFQDPFQDGNADGWTPSTNTWGVGSAAGSLVYRQRDLDVRDARSIRTGLLWANQSVEAHVRPTQFSQSAGTDRWFGIITRYTNASNYYYLAVHSTNTVSLQRKRNGVSTILDSAPLHVAVNRPYRLRIEAIGSRIRGYVDGELRVEAVDRTMRTGRPGLITSGAQANFDNVVATPSPLTTLFADTFNGQFVNDHWQVVSGLWNHVIAGSQGLYAQTSTQVQGRVLTGVDTHDQVVEAEASSDALTAGASYGLMARYGGDGNFYYLRVGENNQISLQKFVNGSSFELDRATLVVGPGTWHRLRLEVLGNALRGYVDGRFILEARDQSHVAGKYGLTTFRTAAQFDNVQVTQP